MKSYTDFEQSKKLAEILPLESADMLFQHGENKYADSIRGVPLDKKHWEQMMMPAINPCWSLAALLDVLPEGVFENYHAPYLQKEDGKYSVAYGNEELLCVADNPVDACYEMIVKLHEQNLLKI